MKDNEKLFLEQVKPLIDKIHDICHTEGINSFMVFQCQPKDPEKGTPLVTDVHALDGNEDPESNTSLFASLVAVTDGAHVVDPYPIASFLLSGLRRPEPEPHRQGVTH